MIVNTRTHAFLLSDTFSAFIIDIEEECYFWGYSTVTILWIELDEKIYMNISSACTFWFWNLNLVTFLLFGIQAKCRNFSLGEWEGPKGGWSPKAHWRECKINHSRRQEGGSIAGHEWTMQVHGPEEPSHLVYRILTAWNLGHLHDSEFLLSSFPFFIFFLLKYLLDILFKDC